MTIRSLSFWCTTAISVIRHWVSIENSWICTIVINVMKSKKLMGHCFCHYWMFDAQIGLSLSFRKMRLNVWFMMFVSINLDILWWCFFQMSEYLLFDARLSCMNDWFLWYLYLFTLTCSSFFVYWDLLNPNKLLNWTCQVTSHHHTQFSLQWRHNEGDGVSNHQRIGKCFHLMTSFRHIGHPQGQRGNM